MDSEISLTEDVKVMVVIVIVVVVGVVWEVGVGRLWGFCRICSFR